MYSYEEIMKVLDADENAVLYLLETHVDTAVLVYNDGEANEEVYVLTDWQGTYPRTLDEVADYDWELATDGICF